MVCTSPTTINFPSSNRGTSVKTVEIKTLPEASPGTRRSLEIIRYNGKKTGPKVYIQAGLHADEAPGYVVLYHLRKLLDQADESGEINGEIIIVPAANPIGLSQWRDETLQGRFDFANSINFNRQHQDLVDRVAEKIGSELGTDAQKNIAVIRKTTADILAEVIPKDEAESLKHLLISLSHDADIVLDLHCDLQALMHVYLGTSLWPDATDLSAYLGADTTLLAADSGGTPFDEANSRLWWNLAEKFPNHPIPSACLSATVELRGIADTNTKQAKEDAKNLLSFLQNRKSISGDTPKVPPLHYDATPLTGVDYIKATVPGIVSYLKTPGELVKKGDVIAEILNPLAKDETNKVTVVTTATDGLLFSRNTDRFARPGRIIAKVAGKIPLREESGHLLTM